MALVSFGPKRVMNIESPGLNPAPSKTIFVAINLATPRRMDSGFTITWGPDLEGSSFLGGLEQPESIKRHTDMRETKTIDVKT
jgi:hypothetical protein